jgi:hypothetical protein
VGLGEQNEYFETMIDFCPHHKLLISVDASEECGAELQVLYVYCAWVLRSP